MNFDVSKIGGMLLANFLKSYSPGPEKVTAEDVSNLIGSARRNPALKSAVDSLGNLTEADVANVVQLVNKAKGFGG